MIREDVADQVFDFFGQYYAAPSSEEDDTMLAQTDSESMEINLNAVADYLVQLDDDEILRLNNMVEIEKSKKKKKGGKK